MMKQTPPRHTLSAVDAVITDWKVNLHASHPNIHRGMTGVLELSGYLAPPIGGAKTLVLNIVRVDSLEDLSPSSIGSVSKTKPVLTGHIAANPNDFQCLLVLATSGHLKRCALFFEKTAGGGKAVIWGYDLSNDRLEDSVDAQDPESP